MTKCSDQIIQYKTLYGRHYTRQRMLRMDLLWHMPKNYTHVVNQSVSFCFYPMILQASYFPPTAIGKL